MKTQILEFNPEWIDSRLLEAAGDVLRSGGLVAFPTETVYGLGGDALRGEVSRKIYAAKGRPSDNPLIVHVGRIEDVDKIAARIPEQARAAMDAFWPGPLTIILEKKPIVPDPTTGGLRTVAVRMPDHPVTLALLRQTGILMAGPSANLSGKPSPTTARHVRADLDGRIEMILDGGPSCLGIESTIVDFTVTPPMILRPGFVSAEQLAYVTGSPVALDPAVFGKETAGKEAPRAPGMKYRHYAPAADLILVEGAEPEHVVRAIGEYVLRAAAEGRRTGVLTTEENRERYPAADVVRCVGSRRDDATVAAGLYAALREFDDLGVDVIYSESFPGGEHGQAIMNRLLKAAGHQVLEAEHGRGHGP